MPSANARPGFLLVALFIVCAAIPAVTAQDAALEVGTLYFTPKLLQEPFTGANGIGTPVTGTRVHAFSDAPPTAAAAQKVYLQTSFVAQTYATEFTYKFSEPTEVSGTVTAKIWLSCDVAAPFRPAYDTGGVNDLHGYRLEIRRGTASTAAALAQSKVFTTLPTCMGPSTVIELAPEATFASPSAFEADEVLSARVLVWTLTGHESIAKNVHFLVNSTSRPASLVGAGLPLGPASTATATNLFVAARQETIEAAPGQKVHTNLTIRNPSNKALNVTINATGDYPAAANSAPIELPANATTLADVTVMPPQSAMVGDKGTITYHVFLDDKEVGNATINVTIVAASNGSGTSSGGPAGSGANNAATNATGASNETAGAKSVDGNDTPGLGLGAIVAATIGVAALLRRRRA